MAVTCISSEIKRDIGRKSFFSYPLAFDTPFRTGGPRRNRAVKFGTEKLDWWGYPKVKKIWRYVYSFWHDPRTWQTDWDTDIAWRHRPRLCIASHGKNQSNARPCDVNMFKTTSLRDRWAEVDKTWHVHSTGLGTKLLGSRILNFGPCAARSHPELSPVGRDDTVPSLFRYVIVAIS